MQSNLRLHPVDLCMALSNAMQLSGSYILSQTTKPENKTQLRTDLAIPLTLIIGGSLIHALANWATVSPNASPLRRMLSLPFPNNLKIKLKGFNLEFLGRIKRITTLYNVVQNTFRELTDCARHLKTKPIQALTYSIVHTFNLGAELFYTANYFSILDSNYPFSPKPLALSTQTNLNKQETFSWSTRRISGKKFSAG